MTLPTLTELLLMLYDKEVNIRIESFFDKGWALYVGDIKNGYMAELHGLDLNQVCAMLHKLLIKGKI